MELRSLACRVLVLAFTLSLDDLVIASFVTGPSATILPMVVFSSVRLGVSPEVNALATLFLAVVFVLGALAFWLMGRQERRRPLPIPRAASGGG